MQFSKHNNNKVLDAMKSISEITELDPQKLPRTLIVKIYLKTFNLDYSNSYKIDFSAVIPSITAE